MRPGCIRRPAYADTVHDNSGLRRNSVASGVVASLWIVLVWGRPDTTFHVAPILVAGALPIAHRVRSGRLATDEAAAAALVGIFTVILVTLALAWSGKLLGPSVLPFGGPAVEAVAFGFAGGVAAAAVASFEP